MNSIMPNQQPFSRKQNFPLRLFAAAFVISLLTTIFSGWQMWQMDHRVEALSDKRAALFENIGSIMLYDEVLTMSARMAAATGDFSYEKRYDEFDPQLVREIDALRAILPQAGIAEFVRETDEANNELVKMERQAFALTHQGRQQDAAALLTSAEYLRLKKVYAGGMQKTVSAANDVIEREVRYLDYWSSWSVAASATSALVLLATWFLGVRSARNWAAERREAEDVLRKIRDELLQHRERLEQEVAQRTVGLTDAQRIAHLGNWEWDIVNNRLDWSDEIYRIFGLTPQQFGASYEAFLQAMHPEDRQLVEDNVREALEQGCPYNIDHRIQLPDGTVRHVHEQAEVQRNESGQAIKMRGTVQDITERKSAQEEIRKQQELTSKIIETIPMRVFWKDHELRYLGCNTLFAKDAGLAHPEELIGKTDYDMGWKDQAELYQADDRRVMDSDTAKLSYDEPQTTPDGGQIWLRTSKVPLHGENNESIGILGTYEDITEHKLAQQALEESELKFRTILESAVDGILLADGESHQFVTANQAICNMLGYKKEEIFQLGLADIHPAESIAYVQGQFERQLRGEIKVALNLPVRRKDGTVFFSDVSSSPMVLAGRPFLVGIFHDVTERMLAEEKISQLNEELELKVQQRTQQLVAAQEELVRKEKLAVLGQVAGSVGHELRNPLGVMNNAVYFLQTVLTDADDTTKEYLNIIKDEIASSERIVSDLLDSVRTKQPHPETVGVRELIEQTLRKLNFPEGTSVELDIPESIRPLHVDGMQLLQVFRNLISNGAEAMLPAGGVLHIRAVENPADGTITVSVQDSGCGIAPEQMEHMFQPLFTTKARGIGLGLVVVKNLTEANGGKIELNSEPGKGATFAVTLPAAHQERNQA
jgi:PAS domain S-box-containing protein